MPSVGMTSGMTAFLIILVLLIALGILGAVVKGLLWLTLIAVVLIVAAAAWGYFKLRGSMSERRSR